MSTKHLTETELPRHFNWVIESNLVKTEVSANAQKSITQKVSGPKPLTSQNSPKSNSLSCLILKET